MSTSKTQEAVPVEIGRINVHDIKIRWKDGHESVYPARALRLKCPCALCVDEMTRMPLIKEETIPQDVHPLKVNLVGRYAISIKWSDGHDTGIYTFESLREMNLE
ncbi:DUF971 domain-containing protein [candidate division KSB1 bacterium]